jgi:hypothetical protein
VGKCYGGGPRPIFVQQPQDLKGYLANSITLEGMALGTPRPTYQWYHSENAVAGATNSALTPSKLSEADAGPYVLVASNRFGATPSRTAMVALTGYETITQGFEVGWDGWTSDDYAIWQVGQPTSGPASAHLGSSAPGPFWRATIRTARLAGW